MNLRQHEGSDSMKVWLSESDTETLLDAAQTTEQRIAFALGARCGLRSHEILQVSPDDVIDTQLITSGLSESVCLEKVCNQHKQTTR